MRTRYKPKTYKVVVTDTYGRTYVAYRLSLHKDHAARSVFLFWHERNVDVSTVDVYEVKCLETSYMEDGYILSS